MIKAYIFDLDGTLYPRTNPLFASMSALMKRWFQSQMQISDEKFDDWYEWQKSKYPTPLKAIEAFGLNVVSFHWEVFGRLCPEMYLTKNIALHYMLNKLIADKFIVTLSLYEHAIRVLNVLGIRDCFSGILVHGRNWHTNSKLDAYETVRRENGLISAEICVIGDNPRIDLLEASEEGYRCVAVYSSESLPGIQSIPDIIDLPAITRGKALDKLGERSIRMDEQTIQHLHASFSRTTEDIFSKIEWDGLLRSGEQLRIKYGVDVTAPYLHIGHAVNLWMMRKLQDLGHKVIFLIGDFTTQIGDPTGKSKTRPVISLEEIERNTAEFIEQVKLVLRFDDPSLLEVRRNSEWYNAMPLSKFLKLMSLVTHSRLISRDMFQKRIADNADIYMHELVYPLLQGYDSFMLESDLTIIGSDQLFNEMIGRFYQDKFGQRPQVIITTKITPGIDGAAKQSKSLDNYIGLGHSPRDKFGRTMRLPDALILMYFKVYTEVPESELSRFRSMVQSNPMEAKKLLATEIVRRYHGEETAYAERDWFDQAFSQRQAPQDAPTVTVEGKPTLVLDIVKQFFGGQRSTTEIRRLFKQGGIKLNNQKIVDLLEQVHPVEGDVFQVGKRNWFRLHLEE